MGIDIQQYRAKIGSFSTIRLVFYKKKYPTKSSTRCPFFGQKYLFILLCVFKVLYTSGVYSSSGFQPTTNGYPSPSKVVSASYNMKNILTKSYVNLETIPLGVYITQEVDFRKCSRVKNSPVNNMQNEGSLEETFYSLVSNSEMKRVNGNKSERGIKTAHWNKGNSQW